MIAETNTVIDPGTVMVESLNAVFADSAMPTTARSNRFAVRTQLCAI